MAFGLLCRSRPLPLRLAEVLLDGVEGATGACLVRLLDGLLDALRATFDETEAEWRGRFRTGTAARAAAAAVAAASSASRACCTMSATYSRKSRDTSATYCAHEGSDRKKSSIRHMA